ncbi:MAG TPA: hypothetical protein VFE90_00415 [Myxococcales bacterium]|jgi:hypothetical protein|nr:hypothetical protein [Myxococcales bacterium]
MNHPSELKLERHLLDPSRSSVQSHVEGCGDCQSRLALMEKQGEDFRRFVYPATLDKVLEPHTRFRFTPLKALWLAAPAMGLAAVLVMVTRGPDKDYIGEKGGFELTAYAALPDGTRALGNGDTVPANASLRFHVRTKKECALSILSIDASGQVSKLYTQDVRGDVTLSGGVRLDGKEGPERFFAVCGPGYAEVDQAARHVGESVREMQALPGVKAPQSSLLIEKKQ